jgi:hypothetical protein
MNLSVIEGYLGPIVHGVSVPVVERIEWELHEEAEPGSTADEASSLELVPGVLVLEPYPRVLGTINVDADALAPAKKITARAGLILLEPDEQAETAATVDAAYRPAAPLETPPGADALQDGDPRAALTWLALDKANDSGFTAITRAIDTAVSALLDAGQSSNVVSKRDLLRCLLYVSWYVTLASDFPSSSPAAPEEVPQPPKAAAFDPNVVNSAVENSLLHFVLPGLKGPEFENALERIDTTARDGGLLKRRVMRIRTAARTELGIGPVDVWSALT